MIQIRSECTMRLNFIRHGHPVHRAEAQYKSATVLSKETNLATHRARCWVHQNKLSAVAIAGGDVWKRDLLGGWIRDKIHDRKRSVHRLSVSVANLADCDSGKGLITFERQTAAKAFGSCWEELTDVPYALISTLQRKCFPADLQSN